MEIVDVQFLSKCIGIYGIPSGPIDLFLFNRVRRLTTPGEETSMGGISGYL